MKLLIGLVSLIALLLVVLAGPLYKFEILPLGTSFTAMRWGVYIGAATLALTVIQLIFMRKSVSWTVTALSTVFAVVAIGLPLNLMNKAKSVPAIHDITTDLINPPLFDAIIPLRQNAPNPVEYAGDQTAIQQKQAYPELITKQYSKRKRQVFDAALLIANSMNWEVVNSDPAKGIIEATDTTEWFGFKDDVIIRVKQSGTLAEVDMRSKSRVGKSDLGKNADRINAFFAKLDSNVIHAE